MHRSVFALAALSFLLSCSTGGGGVGPGLPGSPSGTGGGGGAPHCSDGARSGDETDIDCGGSCGGCADGLGCDGPDDCRSGVCGAAGMCLAALCGNGRQDATELGVDCGGTCPACYGASCSAHSTCITGYCNSGSCDLPTCSDGVRNGKETGTDCGGDCPQCPVGEPCRSSQGCLTGFCKDGFCAEPSCTDGHHNQTETDVDCGGPCPGCAEGKACSANQDCASGRCDGERCVTVAATCDDGEMNGSETDVDCGGGCPGCGVGKACRAPADCASNLCERGSCDPVPTCSDGEKNGSETDMDCGGDACRACASTKFCEQHSDCLSVTCIFGVCKDPTCDDDVQNQGESDLDCGAVCPPCHDGKVCKTKDDCASARCTNGICTSCDDGVRNADETDRDCGGSCDGCPDGLACLQAGDCASGLCHDRVCASCSNGVLDGGETAPDCGGGCDPCADGLSCLLPSDCASGTCAEGRCISCSDKEKNGSETGVDCGGSCAPCGDGVPCSSPTDCSSGTCHEGFCVSCSDGRHNGDESDIDCGGSCGGCANGKQCGTPVDCLADGCEEGRCCPLNACGVCGALPAEICNGSDDDCDGQTDEKGGIGEAPSCELQKGVCHGSWAECRGAEGWVCDAHIYTVHHERYEADEQSCDNLDNDCDGQTDEPEACDTCSEYELDSSTLQLASQEGEDYEVLHLALEGTKAYVRVGDEVVEVVNGHETSRAAMPAPSVGLLSLGSGVLATARRDEPYSTSKIYLTRFDKAGTVVGETEIATTGFYVMEPVYRDGRFAIGLGGSSGYGRISFSLYTSEGAEWTRARGIDDITSPFDLALDSSGGVHVGHAVYREQYGNWWHSLHYEPPDGDDIQLAYKTSTTNRRVDLRIDAQDTVHIVHTEHETNENIYATIAPGSREVVTQHHFDRYMAMALDPLRSVVMLYQPSHDMRYEAHALRPEDDFVGVSVVNVGEDGWVPQARIEVDEAGRHQILFVHWSLDEASEIQTYAVRHGVVCP